MPPKPYGDIGLSSTIEATAPGWSIAYCSTTPPPSDQPSRCTGCPARHQAALGEQRVQVVGIIA